MKTLLFFLLTTLINCSAHSQSVGIGTTTPNNSAALDVSSSNKGVLLTRLTTAQRKAIASPATGLLVFDTDKNSLYLFDGFTWLPIVATRPDQLPPTERIPDSVKQSDRFGSAVAISGNFAVVGAPTDDANNNPQQGCAYIFERMNGNWIQVARISASDGQDLDHFGHAVSISGDYIAVGAPDDDSGFLLDLQTNHGTVYIFHRVNNNWVQEFKLRANDYSSGDRFGKSLSLVNDRLMVGAPDDENGAITGCGSIYFFQRNGSSWTQVNKFFRPNAGQDDEFGGCVRMHGDYAIAGAEYASTPNNTDGGSVNIYVFGGGTWTIQATIDNPNATNSSYFGGSVDIYNDLVVVGRANPTNNGVVRTFKRTGNSWSEYADFLNGNSVYSGNPGSFGLGLSLFGEYLLVGWTPIDDHRCALYKLRTTSSPRWELVRVIDFSQPTDGYSQEEYYPDFDTYDIDGDNLIFGFPYLGVHGYRSGGILFLNFGE